MEKKFTTAELVKKFGTETQKESYKKYGKLMPKIRDAIRKTAEQYYESVKPIKQGRENLYVCSGKRTKKAARKDNRSKNGQGQLAGEFELNSLVINHLIQNDNKVKPMSATRWLTELDIIDEKLTGALYGTRAGHLEKLQEQFSKGIKDYNKADNDIEMLDEFIQVSLKSMKASLVSAFNKLAKAEAIIYQKEVWGCTTKQNYRKLKQKEINNIASIKRTLLAKHGIKGNDLFKNNMKEVKAFKKEFDEHLQEQLGLKFYYDAHVCVIKDSDLGVHDHLHSLREKGVLDFAIGLTDEYAFTMTQVYKDKYSKRSLELAKGREKNTTNISDSDRVKCLKIMKQYAPMWELLLRYFKCTSCIKSNPSAVEPEVAETIEQTKKEQTNQQQTKQSLKEIESEIREQQGSTVVAKPIVEPSNQYNVEKYYDHEYLAAMEEIRDEIREYEEKYGDEAMERIAFDTVMRELTREVTVEEVVAELEQKWKSTKEREHEEWERMFNRWQPVKWEQTTKNPLEVFYRITGRI